MDIARLLSRRSAEVQESVIRRIFEEGRDVPDPINLTIGQPDFPVPEPIRAAAARAVLENRNGYSSNRGIDPLLAKLAARLKWDLGWDVSPGATAAPGQAGLMVTGGTSGGLICAAMALLDPGDEIIIPDPNFVLYPRLAEFCSAKIVACDTYPDFRMTAARVEPLITARTKAVLFNSPSNPCGVVSSERECRDLLDLCRRRGILLISDEIYDEFTYRESRTQAAAGDGGVKLCPSPCRRIGGRDAGEQETLLIRGFGKTYGCTGWRLGYAAGPAALIDRMIKLQQHLYICAPTPLQWGACEAVGLDVSDLVAIYEHRRGMVMKAFEGLTEVPLPGGAFYAFVKVPERLRMTASRFKDLARSRSVLIVPGAAFSSRDTHFRLSYAVNEKTLTRGLDALVEIMKK